MAKEESTSKVKSITIHEDSDKTIRIERIDNGWLMVEELYTKKDGYKTTKTYVKENPLKSVKLPD